MSIHLFHEDNLMTRLRSVAGNTALLCLAVAGGWWGRGAGVAVLAGSSDSSSSSSRESGGDANLAFQLVGNGPQQSLTMFNPDNHTLYVYPRVTEGNSHISCEYSFTVTRPGAAIDRKNCTVGDQVQQR
jgi:hypothetical protein